MTILPFPVIIAIALTLTTVAQAAERPIRYAFQVFQLSDGFTQKTSLRKKIWKASNKTWDKMKDEVVLFDHGEFRNGKDRLVMRPKSCFWNDQGLSFERGHMIKLPEDKIKIILSPYVNRKEKELVKLNVRSEKPYQYMEAQKNGLFKLQEIKLPTGLDIEVRAHTAKKDVYDIDHLQINLRIVSQREPAKGTNLPVGKPILNESEYKLRLRIQEVDSYGILLQPKGTNSLIVIRLEIDDK